MPISSATTAALLTALFVGTTYSLAQVAIQVFGYPEAGVVWLIVLFQALYFLLAWALGRADFNGFLGSMTRVFLFSSTLFGPFPDPYLALCIWDTATLLFLLGAAALSISMVYYYWTLS